MTWHWIVFGYFAYMSAVALLLPQFAPARRRLLTGAAACVGLAMLARSAHGPGTTSVNIVVPSLVLLSGYWLAGLLFVRRDRRAEDGLRSIDDWLLERTGLLVWYRRRPSAIVEYFELSYLLVYPAVPAGAIVLVLAGHHQELGRFWVTVLLAEFTCYAMLPWIQVWPPRSLPHAVADERASVFRRINQRIARQASIGASTVPSAHTAGALATALAVGRCWPEAGFVFFALAIHIAAGSVLGRYHYLLDAGLGGLVAIAVWAAT